MEITINIRPDIEQCLKWLVRNGRYGQDIKDALERIVQDRIFFLNDVRRFTICGAMLDGADVNRILITLPSGRSRNIRTYMNAKRHWKILTDENIPEKYQKKQQWEEKKNKTTEDDEE